MATKHQRERLTGPVRAGACVWATLTLATLAAGCSTPRSDSDTDLTLTTAVVGNGTVVTSPPGIFCRGDRNPEGSGGRCSEIFFDTQVDLIAQPGPGWNFAYWERKNDGSDAKLTNRNQRVRPGEGVGEQSWIAMFTPVVQAVPDGGTPDAGPDQPDGGEPVDAGQPLLSFTVVDAGLSVDLVGAYSEDGDQGYVFVGGAEGNVLQFNDPTDIFHTVIPSSSQSHLVALSGANAVSVTDNEVHRTFNGATYSKVATIADITRTTSLVWGGNIYVLAGHTADNTGILYSSTDGATWVERRRAPRAGIGLVDVAWDGTRFIGVGSIGVVQTTPDGINWNRETGQEVTAEALITVAASPELALAIGGPAGEHLVIGSADHGVTWDDRGSFPSGASIRQLAWTGKYFVAVGDGGRVYTSQDGFEWMAENSGVTADLLDVVANGPGVVVTGKSGTLLVSPKP